MRPMKRGLMLIAMGAFALIALTGCEDKQTAMARCKVEAFNALGSASSSDDLLATYVINCMKLAGYGVDYCHVSFALAHWPNCYKAEGLLAKLAEQLNGETKP